MRGHGAEPVRAGRTRTASSILECVAERRDDLLRWADELRVEHGIPPRGQDPATHELLIAARGRFQEVVGRPADEAYITGAANVTLMFRGCRFKYRNDGALFFQPLDADGNEFGRAERVESSRDLIPLLEEEAGTDLTA